MSQRKRIFKSKRRCKTDGCKKLICNHSDLFCKKHVSESEQNID